jgi:putative two-component system response regulator
MSAAAGRGKVPESKAGGGDQEVQLVAEVLVAEDDSLTRRFLQQALEFGGHHVTSVGDGAQAIALLRAAGRYDCVVTDYAMPRADGIDVINHAQRVDPTLPCVVVTSYRDLDLAMRAVQAGAVAFVPKPFKTDHLLTVLNGALRRRELATEAMRLRLLAPMLERFTLVLANTLETKDTASQWHANRLVALSGRIATHLGLPDEVRSAIRFGACLHDIGKVGVPEHLLQRAGPLSPEEMEVMRTHPVAGAMILESIDTWQEVRLVVRHHHERYDGAGYPDRLCGEKIPLGARIVAVVDAFDVMRSGRPYAPARPAADIQAEFERQRGRQFDPEMIDALFAVVTAADFSVPNAAEPLPALIDDTPPQEEAAAVNALLGEVRRHRSLA